MMGSSVHDVYSLNGLLERAGGDRRLRDLGRRPLLERDLPLPARRAGQLRLDRHPRRARRSTRVCLLRGSDVRVTITFGQPFLPSAATTVRVQSMEPSPLAATAARAPDDLGWDDPGSRPTPRRSRSPRTSGPVQTGVAALPRLHHAGSRAAGRTGGGAGRRGVHRRLGLGHAGAVVYDSNTQAIRTASPFSAFRVNSASGPWSPEVRSLTLAVRTDGPHTWH